MRGFDRAIDREALRNSAEIDDHALSNETV